MNARPDNLRNRELAQIHIAKKQLALDDETYRDMLWSIGRVRSAGDLDFTGRKRVLAHMKARGFKVKSRSGNPEWGWVDRAAEERRPALRKIIMLLKDGGRAKAYVDGICEKMFGIARIQLCGIDQLHSIVAALMYDQKRRAAKSQDAAEGKCHA